jgi:hypothetical protein
MSNLQSRDQWLAATDDALLADCDVDTYRASGPGGQKRNKTSSAVRLRHGPSGMSVIAEESRSQHENKARCINRLRRAIALEIRLPLAEGWRPPEVFTRYKTASGRLEISVRNRDYPAVAAVILDAIASRNGSMKEAAAFLGVTTGQLSRFVGNDSKTLAAVNAIRKSAGLHPITS